MTTRTAPSPVVLVTGALAGIGRATALAFAREGARLVVSGRNQEAGEALAAELDRLDRQRYAHPGRPAADRLWWPRFLTAARTAASQ